MTDVRNPYEKIGVLEVLVHERRCAQAFECAGELLALLHARYFGQNLDVAGYAGSPYPLHAGLCERFAHAWGTLLLDPQLELAQVRLIELLRHQHALHELVHGTAEGQLDGYMAVLQARLRGRYTPDALVRMLLLWVPGSRVPLDWRQFYPHVPEATVATVVATVGGLVMATAEAHRARESAIEFLDSGVPQAADYRRVGPGIAFHFAWMFCSYAVSPGKHRVKRFLNAVIRQLPVMAERRELPAQAGDGRPVMVVPLENFQSTHAMYRCYAPVIESCRRHFRLVGLAVSSSVDEPARRLFDVFHDIDRECMSGGITDMAVVAGLVRSHAPSIIFYPSIGMQMQNIVLCNQRLAPVQAMTYGHPATSESAFVDYGLTEEQWIVGAERFSEKLVPLPRGTLRYVLHADFSRPLPPRRQGDDVLRVAIPSFAQKWTWPFLETLARVRARVGARVEFHFFTGVAGCSFPAAMNAVLRALPSAVVHPTLTYPEYIAALARCDVHAATFPFGGTNSVFDSLSNGLPVVCLAAREIHGAQEEDFIRRVGLPEWLIAVDETTYADTLVRLVENPAQLAELQGVIADRAHIAALFADGGHPEAFADALRDLARRGAPVS
ncbi:MAG: hypothetical protein ACOY33_12265 [Pseudomonadota bacterium]